MKYCSKCGNELLDEAVFCPKCGCVTGGNIVLKTESGDKNPSNGLAIAGLVLSIVSLALFGLSWAIAAIIMSTTGIISGVIGLVLSSASVKKANKGLSVTGIVLSIVGIIGCIVCLIIMVMLLNSIFY